MLQSLFVRMRNSVHVNKAHRHMSTCNMHGTITFIRHGQSDANQSQVIHGSSGGYLPLSKLGRLQALRAGEKLKDEKFSSVYSSNLTRAFETASLVMSQNSHWNQDCRIKQWPILRERCFGKLEGKTFQDLLDAASAAGYDRSSLSRFNPEDGESTDDLRVRAREFIRDVLSDNADVCQPVRIFVSSHGMFLHEIFLYLSEELDCKLASSTSQENLRVTNFCHNTGLTTFKFRLDNIKDFNTLHVQCLYFNDFSHLDGLENEGLLPNSA